VKKNYCVVCEKLVYPQEQLNADERVYHKSCFRCKRCNNVLKLGSFASMEGEVFCKPCFKKNFFTKGNYSAGFGKLTPQEQHDQATGKEATERKPVLFGAFQGVEHVRTRGRSDSNPKESSPPSTTQSRTNTATRSQLAANLPVIPKSESPETEKKKESNPEEVKKEPEKKKEIDPEEVKRIEAEKKKLEAERKKDEEEKKKQDEERRAARQRELHQIEEDRKKQEEQRKSQPESQDSVEAQKLKEEQKKKLESDRIINESEAAKKREQQENERIAKERSERQKQEEEERGKEIERLQKQREEAGEFTSKADVKFSKPAPPGSGGKRLIKTNP